VAKSFNRLGLVLEAENKHAEAEAMLCEALEIRRKRLGSDHPDLASSLSNLGFVLCERGKYSDAEPLYRESLQNRRARLGPEHQEVLAVIANLGRLLSDWAWAERLEKSHADNPKSEPARRAGEAEELLRDCLAIRLKGTNATDWSTDDWKSRLGSALVSVCVTDPSLTPELVQSKLAEAENLLLEANSRLLPSRSAERWSKRDSLEGLVRLYGTWDNLAPNADKSFKAQEWRQKLDALRAESEQILAKQRGGPDH
jgi:tetratricopeptide (TPR) repeat protein